MTLQVLVVVLILVSSGLAWIGGQRNQSLTLGFSIIFLAIALMISLIAKLG